MYRISAGRIRKKKQVFICDNNELRGVQRVAGYVCSDFEKVFGTKPEMKFLGIRDGEIAKGNKGESEILFGTKGSRVFDLAMKDGIDISVLEGRRECYLFRTVTNQGTARLYILGSDKRGAIYGLFHLSELCGVSPFVNWGQVLPVHKDEVILTEEQMFLSPEPSVKYRGFFINDEWPAFGNWCNHRFGGFNAKMYEGVFELLLRMKGNYLWPAMWSAIFSNDGPGLENPELADELGVVMGLSHHEPCLRHGEEYKYLRGKDSIYGDAWNFRTNREGITRFWEDGLKRSGGFENVVTVGMRGEADSTILGKDATLQDNIDLLKDVLKVQMELIQKYVNPDLDQVPRMLALYKEVEPFYYGDENTPGLMHDPILDGVTLMLCDDNHGNLRTLPDDRMKGHKGGFGMYYHLDYHGWPVSYEWVNSTELSKVWDQMCNAYESGIRELWIVNVGDVFTNEYPLSYFMNMAYDYDHWGLNNPDSYKEYSRRFVDQIFGERMTDPMRQEAADLLTGYTGIANMRRPEAMNDKIYAPFAYREREEITEKCSRLMDRAQHLMDVIKKSDGDGTFAFYEFVYYPLMANLNLQKMWLDTTYNHALCRIGACMANKVAEVIDEEVQRDEELVRELHEINDGYWYGMGMSEHIGFKNWNEEECSYPKVGRIRPAHKTRMIALIPETGEHTEGGDWTGKKLVLPDFARYDKDRAEVYLYAASDQETAFEVTEVSPGLKVTPARGTFTGMTKLQVELITEAQEVPDGTEVSDASSVSDVSDTNELRNGFYFKIQNAFGSVRVEVLPPDWPAPYFVMDAVDGESRGFIRLDDFGKNRSALKADPRVNVPEVLYNMEVPEAGDYLFRTYLAPGNPPYKDNFFGYDLQINGGNRVQVRALPEDYRIQDGYRPWEESVLDQIHIVETQVKLVKGVNEIKIIGRTPGITIEKLVVYRAGDQIQESYLGPISRKHSLDS